MHLCCGHCGAAFANPSEDETCPTCPSAPEPFGVAQGPADWFDADDEAEAEWFAEQDGKHTLVGWTSVEV